MAASLTLAGLFACSREPTAPPSEQRGAFQILSGLVTDGLGAVIAGVPVRVTGVAVGFSFPPQVSVGGCTGNRWFTDSLQAKSAARRFALRVGFGPITPPLCLVVEVPAPAHSGLRDGVASVTNVLPTSTTEVPDTTRVIVILGRQ